MSISRVICSAVFPSQYFTVRQFSSEFRAVVEPQKFASHLLHSGETKGLRKRVTLGMLTRPLHKAEV